MLTHHVVESKKRLELAVIRHDKAQTEHADYVAATQLAYKRALMAQQKATWDTCASVTLAQTALSEAEKHLNVFKQKQDTPESQTQVEGVYVGGGGG